MKVKNAYELAVNCLKSITDEAENEAKILVSTVADIPIGMLSLSEIEVDEEKLNNYISRRLKGEPLQYIIGKWWFYKGEFLVGEGVLIPRQDTEALVETAAELLKGKSAPTVCDLCSGSGCIAISIATDFPNASVLAVEKYEKAFSYLKKNIEHNGTENVRAVQADVTEGAFGKYDLILSNPPYITAKDMKELSTEVQREPETALYGGEDGLYFYRIITEKWKPAVKKGGSLVFEVGINEADAVADILKQNGFKNITVRNDLCGVQRVVFGTVI